MAQVMVNFRMDESVKKSMELACKEMGMSMTTAFTIFATKVGREKRIPFEITAESPRRSPDPLGLPERREEEPSALERKRERLERLCAEIRRSLTAIHTAVPASITGLTMERIRLLCGDELKDKTAGTAAAVRSLFTGRNALGEKDERILDEYLEDLSAIADDVGEIERALVPAMRSWTGGDAEVFKDYERRLVQVSRDLDGLRPVMERFLRSAARRRGGARAVQARLQQAGERVQTDSVLTALEKLEALVLQSYGELDEAARARLETHYLQTLELALEELARAERSGEDTDEKAALCLRAVHVLSQVISGGGRARRERDRRNLEAEVTALERLAALRGDAAGDTLA